MKLLEYDEVIGYFKTDTGIYLELQPESGLELCKAFELITGEDIEDHLAWCELHEAWGIECKKCKKLEGQQ